MKALLLALLLPLSVQAQTAADQFHPRKGVNFDIWVDWQDTAVMLASPGFPDTYPDWRRHVTFAAIADLTAQGYDFARLPKDPAPLLALGPGPRQDALIDQIRQDAELVQSAGLNVIIDMHAFPRPHEDWGVDAILSDPAKFSAYTALIGKIAGRLNRLPPAATAFEPMNEPTSDCDAIWGDATPHWPAQLQSLYTAARANAPDLPLVLTGACWGGPEGLAALTPIADDNVIWSFHSYTPFLFTHQGADWTGSLAMVLHHLPYPPTLLTRQTAQDLARDASHYATAQQIVTDPPATEANLNHAFSDYRAHADGRASEAAQIAAYWADAHHIPHGRLLLGEFGAIQSPGNTAQDKASRLRYLRAKALSAQSLGIGWAVWAWSGNFGVSDGTVNRRPDGAVCQALGLLCR
ncbi:MAG: cellulase family glycosylhydrolase [Pseudorhodobacter sp.]|nr:cellulase family glycosylhydrolase [Pseudorhodobacter sp.]